MEPLSNLCRRLSLKVFAVYNPAIKEFYIARFLDELDANRFVTEHCEAGQQHEIVKVNSQRFFELQNVANQNEKRSLK